MARHKTFGRSRLGLWRLIGFCGFCLSGCGESSRKSAVVVPASAPAVIKAIVTEGDEELLHKLCRQCHLFADPNVLPKSEWESVILSMSRMPGYGRAIPQRIDTTAVIKWFRERAPDALTVSDRSRLPLEPPRLNHQTLLQLSVDQSPFVSQVKLVKWLDTEPPRLLMCDMRSGILSESVREGKALSVRVLANQVSHAVRMELTDLDGDGRSDLVVANLGSFAAMDHNLGTVDWLHPTNGGWERITLAENLGRVADLKAFDFDSDGDLDLAVAEFGWRNSGHVWLLENTTRKNSNPRTPHFSMRILDERHGAEQLEITDIDGDGRLDVLVLLAQEHEVLVAYLNQAAGNFLIRELHRAAHPGWGYSGFQMLDFDGDQDLDVLITNGDMMDGGAIKPYHGISWLENLGALKFVEHPLAEVPGVHRAEAADLDNDGDLDIVACTLHPDATGRQVQQHGESLPPALIWLEQTAPRTFQFHVWERGPGRYPTLTTGDFDGDGRIDVALGVGQWNKRTSTEAPSAYVELWTSGSK